MSIESISLVKGAAPLIIVGLSVAALGLSLRFADTTWRRQLAIGVPITVALVGIAALLVDGLALIPYQFPNSYYLWVGLVVLAVVMCAIGWRRFRNWRRMVSLLSVVLTTVMAMTLINQHYQYYPTVGAALGVEAQHQVAAAELDSIRKKSVGIVPPHGVTVDVAIPGTVSGFKARNAEIWLPPAWIANPDIHLPVIELIAGVPGSPTDWTRGGFADQTANRFAAAHHGLAPIIVMPDANGSATADTECVNSSRGQAETYLTVDVPRFVQKTYGASTAPRSMAVAGLSAGGMCSTMLALRHPNLYSTFGDYAGLTSPTVDESVARDDTIQQLFDGSASQYAAHDPLTLLANRTYTDLGGWFEVGTADYGPLAAQRQLVSLAENAQIATRAVEVPGAGHDFDLFAQAFEDSLPWLSYRLGITPAPANDTTGVI